MTKGAILATDNILTRPGGELHQPTANERKVIIIIILMIHSILTQNRRWENKDLCRKQSQLDIYWHSANRWEMWRPQTDWKASTVYRHSQSACVSVDAHRLCTVDPCTAHHNLQCPDSSWLHYLPAPMVAYICRLHWISFRVHHCCTSLEIASHCNAGISGKMSCYIADGTVQG